MHDDLLMNRDQHKAATELFRHLDHARNVLDGFRKIAPIDIKTVTIAAKQKENWDQPTLEVENIDAKRQFLELAIAQARANVAAIRRQLESLGIEGISDEPDEVPLPRRVIRK